MFLAIISSLLTHFVPSGAYYHKYFVREERHLCHKMIRKMNIAEKKAQQAKKGAQQKKPKDTPVESSAPSSSIDADPTLNMSHDSAYFKEPEIKSCCVEIEPTDSSMPHSEQTKFNQHQLAPQGAASMPSVMQMANGAQGQQGNNIAGTISWLLSEGVSLADLGNVLNISNSQQNSQARSMQQLPMPQAAPQQPVSNSSNQSPADFAEDVISLFGNPCPPSVISFANHQVHQQPMNNNSPKQEEEYSDELYQSICFGQDSFPTSAI